MIPAIPFLIAVGVILPLLGWLSLNRSHAQRNNRSAVPGVLEIAAQLAALQTIVALLALLAAYGAGLTLAWLPKVSLSAILAAAFVFGVVLLLSILEAKKPLGPEDHVRAELRKVSAKDPVWVGVTIYAGLVEELAYRGVLTLLLVPFVGYWPAALASAVLFGLAHLASGWRAAAHSLIFALLMQVLVYLSEGLLLAVIVHTAYDLVAAWLGYRIAVRGVNGRPRDVSS